MVRHVLGDKKEEKDKPIELWQNYPQESDHLLHGLGLQRYNETDLKKGSYDMK